LSAIAGHEERVAIAVCNSPSSTVLSGDPAALQQILAELERRDVFCRPVKVDVASHSPQMDELTPYLLAALALLAPSAPEVPFYPTVGGRLVPELLLDADYWVRNLRQPVLFASAIEQLLDSDHDVFVEMSPHPILLSPIQQAFKRAQRAGLALPSLRREEA